MDGLVRVAHVPRAAIAIRIHRHRREAEFTAGADHTDSDFATVGDEDFHACNCNG
jgi:hypothetical protein